MRKKLIPCLSLISVVIAAIVLFNGHFSKLHIGQASVPGKDITLSTGQSACTSSESEITAETLTVPEIKKIYEVSVISAGDILFHMPQVTSAQENGSYNFKPMFSEIKDLVSSKDISTANFETTVNPKKSFSGYPAFNTPVQALEAVRDAGFQVLVNAHNHSLDTGLEGLRSTNGFMKQHGFKVLGAGEPGEDKSVIVEKNNIKVGMLAYTYGTNFGIQYKDMINYIDENKIKNEIEKIKPNCDYLIVFLHLGTEYVRTVEPYQADLVKKVARAGADAILCSHPHVARKTELIKEDGREILVNYSMGNFISNQNDKYTDIGSMQSLVIQKMGDSTKLKSAETIPVYRLRYNSNGKTIYKAVTCDGVNKYSNILGQNTLAYVEQASSELKFTHIGKDIQFSRSRLSAIKEGVN